MTTQNTEPKIDPSITQITFDRNAFGLAGFSQDMRFRYTLERYLTPRDAILARTAAGDPHERVVTFIMLNPSTADAMKNDLTVRKCITFASHLKADTLRVVNLFALRATDPRELKKAGNLELAGADYVNDFMIKSACEDAFRIYCAWGTKGALWNRAGYITEVLALDGIELSALRVTASGFPEHPLYIPYDVTPVRRVQKAAWVSW
jgi:hypothetical protein